jgi:hypothetical protein
VLQNYFCDPSAQYRFKDERKRASLIQKAIPPDSIIACSQCSKEFCNTIDPQRTSAGAEPEYAQSCLDPE